MIAVLSRETARLRAEAKLWKATAVNLQAQVDALKEELRKLRPPHPEFDSEETPNA